MGLYVFPTYQNIQINFLHKISSENLKEKRIHSCQQVPCYKPCTMYASVYIPTYIEVYVHAYMCLNGIQRDENKANWQRAKVTRARE
jgi:hypothetical protein